ncbi:MAG: 4-alpha-glucanotransferase [Clostridia bacterium]|nr:4-alpha-glucanotransferase [Clostridia bacterium]
MKRASGVLMHISSLYGDYGIGSFGKEAIEFVDFLKEAGFSYWQVLPFCMIDECNSPYKSYSAFGGNPYFVDLPALYEEGLITKEELDSARQQTPYSAEYVRLYHTRCDLLIEASKRVTNKAEIEAFIDNDKYLLDFCSFMALKHKNNQLPWYEWTSEEYDEDVLFGWKFIQFKFFTQWAKIKKYANENGIKIIGDIPIYVSLDSADVWGNKSEFLLDERNNPTHVAGVPPDYFCPDGQLWGNPLYNWEKMRQTDFNWWQARIKHNFTMFDVVRIDHFRAIESYWAVPAGEKTAKNGTWEKGPGMDLIRKIHEVQGDNFVIAEDLGHITREVEQLVRDSGFLGMRVFQFAFMNNENNPHLPHNYINNSIAYTGTHDNNTLLGYLWELDGWTKGKMLEYCGYLSPDWERGYDAILRTLFESNAGLVVLPIQDLLGYGSDTRLNIPGKADGNWQYRVTKEQINSIDKKKFRHLSELYHRM